MDDVMVWMDDVTGDVDADWMGHGGGTLWQAGGRAR